MSAERIPIGLQLVGRKGGEADLLRLAYAYEQATPCHSMHQSLEQLI
jgi:Asp-tRNA(Asn)/Glu-tRNA(Gln) amidotransferase A subunit family amidase